MNQVNEKGREEGYWEHYYGTNIIHKGYYIDGLRDGYWEVSHSYGFAYIKRNYKMNKREGLWEYCDYTGELLRQEYYI